MFDIIFISYQEPNADKNFKHLLSRFPIAQRVHGIKGIHQAHIEAAKKALTKMFWVVDGDAKARLWAQPAALHAHMSTPSCASVMTTSVIFNFSC